MHKQQNERITTKKQAREMGLLPASDWQKTSNGQRLPLRDAVGVLVKGERFYARSETEDLVSKTEAGRRGLKLSPGAEPIMERHGSIGGKSTCWEVYRLSDCTPKPIRQERPPVEVDILVATFAVNRAAKRYRDAASSNYHSGTHGFAGCCSVRKQDLYALKDLGIIAAYRQGRIRCAGIHGTLAIYYGEDYCFHSPLVPESLNLESIDTGAPITVEAKPRETREPRLKDAEYTLASLPESMDGFCRLEMPRFENREVVTHQAADDHDDEDSWHDDDWNEDW